MCETTKKVIEPKAGEVWCTEDGTKVKIVGTDWPGTYPIYGYAVGDKDEAPEQWTWSKGGKYYETVERHLHNLSHKYEEPMEITIWVDRNDPKFWTGAESANRDYRKVTLREVR